MQKLIVGIDIGGTNTKFGLTDLEGNVVFQSKIKKNCHHGSFIDLKTNFSDKQFTIRFS